MVQFLKKILQCLEGEAADGRVDPLPGVIPACRD